MDERPEAVEVLAVVRIDGRRCEMHEQCEGLSSAIFRTPEQQIAVRAGAADGYGDVRYVERLIRTCPMGALELHRTPSEQSPQAARENSS
ncbi:ferredoxin [Streptomyces sp. NPDC001817]|uniref:ferredoxin n=1 Tax=Streptomyces sp. NPDC001817 TaxID=3154398 RepID=UPI00331B2A98